MRIIFKYSWIYDQIWKTRLNNNFKRLDKYPSPNEIKEYIELQRIKWAKYETKILSEISKITGLEWQEDKIYCYIVGFCTAFSDPLTLSMKANKNFIDTLAHELIHQIQIQNSKKLLKSYTSLKAKYPNESILTINHIILFAVYMKLYLKLFDRKRLQKNKPSKNQEYVKAWQIVEKEGSENILEGFFGFPKMLSKRSKPTQR